MVLMEAKNERPVDERSSNLHIRLAETEPEIFAAQNLRYRVFVEEMSAKPTPQMIAERREFDSFDEHCDHLLIFDTSKGEPPGEVVATYRFQRRNQAKRAGGFYTATEYDISLLLAFPGEVMELGRSCVEPSYRTGACMQLLWRGIAAYVLYYDVELLFGCASLHGVDPQALALPLAYLHHHRLAPPALRPRALKSRYTNMNLLPQEEIDPRVAVQTLPPLVKGYVRLGAFFGDGAVIDHEFGTTDVCVVVEPDRVTEKYRKHLIAPARRARRLRVGKAAVHHG